MYEGKTIKINYNAYLQNDWYDIVGFHLECLVKSGLYVIADEINFFAYPINQNLLKLLKEYKTDRIRVIWKQQNDYEHSPISDLIENPFDLNLYFHSKGTSKHSNNPLKTDIKSWNIYMTQYMIADYKQCISLLNDNDLVGVDFKEPTFPHFHGNFWWSRGEYLKKLKGKKIVSEYTHDRMVCEMIPCSEDCKVVSLCQSGKSLYSENFTIDKWKTEPKDYDIIHNRKCIIILCDDDKVQRHEEMEGYDFIRFKTHDMMSMITDNWKTYSIPTQLRYLPYEKLKFILSIIAYRYLDYDEVCYSFDLKNTIETVKNKSITESNSMFVRNGNVICTVHVNSNDRQKIKENRIVTEMLNVHENETTERTFAIGCSDLFQKVDI